MIQGPHKFLVHLRSYLTLCSGCLPNLKVIYNIISNYNRSNNRLCRWINNLIMVECHTLTITLCYNNNKYKRWCIWLKDLIMIICHTLSINCNNIRRRWRRSYSTMIRVVATTLITPLLNQTNLFAYYLHNWFWMRSN